MSATEGHESGSPALEVRGLAKRYKETLAVDDLSFTVPRGEIFALVGANGAGKTTTMAMVLGLVLPTAGSVSILGQPPHRRRAELLGRMNFSSPYVDLPHRLTVRQNLTVYGDLYGVPRLRERIDELLSELGIGDLAGRVFGKLSSGQRTRVSLAKALLNRPEVLLLDEPTASLDPDMSDRVRRWLAGYRERSGATIFVTSHNMTEVERLADRVLILRKGSAVAAGTPAEVIAEYGRATLEEVFLDIARAEAP